MDGLLNRPIPWPPGTLGQSLCLTNDYKKTQNYHKEMQNYHKEMQNDYKEK